MYTFFPLSQFPLWHTNMFTDLQQFFLSKRIYLKELSLLSIPTYLVNVDKVGIDEMGSWQSGIDKVKLTKWQLTKWELTKWEVDKVGLIKWSWQSGNWLNGNWQSGNKPVTTQRSDLLWPIYLLSRTIFAKQPAGLARFNTRSIMYQYRKIENNHQIFIFYSAGCFAKIDLESY